MKDQQLQLPYEAPDASGPSEGVEHAEVPVVLVVSGPSGAGKSSLVRLYLERHPETCLVVSATTREKRSREVDGEDYHFVSREFFQEGLQRQAFLEWAEVHGNYYGSPRDQVEEAQSQGRDVILEIDVQGGRKVKASRPDAVLCFLTPPDPQELRDRLVGRAQDSKQVIETRMHNALKEYQALHDYEYWIINDKLEQAYAELRAVVLAEKCRLARQQVPHLIQSFTQALRD